MTFKPRLLKDVEEREYFLRRALEEEKAALAAVTLKARWVHEELATLYRAHAHAIAGAADPPLNGFRPENAAA
jgi:hypothetical protein